MPTRFDEKFIDDVKRRTSLAALIGRTVRLTRASVHELKGCCPFHTEKTASFYVNDTKGVYICRGSCGEKGDCFTWMQAREGYTFVAAVEELAVRAGLLADSNGHKPKQPAPVVAAYDPIAEEQERAFKAARAGDVFKQCTALAGTAGERYLNGREIFAHALPERIWPPTVRFLERCEWVDCNDDGKVLRREFTPAVVAAIQAPDRHIIGIQKIHLAANGEGKAGLLSHDGSKADKKMYGSFRGGAVRLGLAGIELDVAEGLETSLTVMMGAGAPVWAALSISNMGTIDFPDHVQAITKWLDADESDRAQARKLIAKGNERHARAGLVVRCAGAPEGHDWNSYHMERVKAARARATEHAAREVA